MPPKYIIFRCNKDDCWVVSVYDADDGIYLGVAECPDEGTARNVLEAMEMRREYKCEESQDDATGLETQR